MKRSQAENAIAEYINKCRSDLNLSDNSYFMAKGILTLMENSGMLPPAVSNSKIKYDPIKHDFHFDYIHDWEPESEPSKPKEPSND